MPFKIIKGDILEQKADIIVITTRPRPYSPVSGDSSKVFEAAGYDRMLEARASFEKIKPGEIVVTPGFDLNVRHVIHVCEHVMYTKEISDIITYRTAIEEGVHRALKWAEQNEAKTVAFSVIGEYDLTVTPISNTIKKYFDTENSRMNVYQIVPPDDELVFYSRYERDKLSDRDSVPENYDDDYAEYSRRFEEQLKKSDMTRSVFCRKYIDDRLTGLYDVSYFAKIIGCNRTTLYRIIDGTTAKPNKSKVLALAILLELSHEERYNFINCFEHPYPADKRDHMIESLMRSGITDLESIDNRICKQDPKKALRKKAKSPNNTQEK